MPRKNGQSETPSGSNWGSDELDRFHFEQKSRLHGMEHFPWKDLFATKKVDPIEDVSQSIELLFGAAAEAGNSPRGGQTTEFFNMLDSLKGRHRELATAVLPRTRSKGAMYSSSPIGFNYVAGNTREDESESEWFPIPAFDPSLGYTEGHTSLDPELHETASREPLGTAQVMQADRKTPPKRTKKRRPSRGLEGHRVQSPLKSVFEDIGQDDDKNPLPEHENESNCTQSIDFEDHGDVRSATQEDYSSIPQENLVGVPFFNQHFPSSQSDSTYQGAYNESQEPTTPPTPKFKQDQAEDSTNLMMNTLLMLICRIITKQASRPGLGLYVTSDRDPLVVPVDGQFPTTKPDLAIKLDRNGTELTILDYEASTTLIPLSTILLYGIADKIPIRVRG